MIRINSGISRPTSVPTSSTTPYSATRKEAPSLKVKKRNGADTPPASATISSISTKRCAIPLSMKRDSHAPMPSANRYTPMTVENWVMESPSR